MQYRTDQSLIYKYCIENPLTLIFKKKSNKKWTNTVQPNNETYMTA